MYLYTDLITGDELFSDANKIEDLGNGLLKVTGKIVSESGEVKNLESLIGGNKSAEDPAQEDVDNAAVTTGIDVVINHRLQESPAYDTKKALADAIKDYCKRLKEKLDPEIAKEFQATIPNGAKYLLKNYKNYQVFCGESFNTDGGIIFVDYEEDGKTPFLLFFKHGLVKEKV